MDYVILISMYVLPSFPNICRKLYTSPKTRVFELEVYTVMGTAGILRQQRGNRSNGDHIHGNTVGTGSNADCNTAVKWKKDEQ